MVKVEGLWGNVLPIVSIYRLGICLAWQRVITTNLRLVSIPCEILNCVPAKNYTPYIITAPKTSGIYVFEHSMW